jgi:hypothetical protein
MTTQETTLTKGEDMEESLRNYFLNLGYYVARGVLFRHNDIDVTDIDLMLYGRNSSLGRQRINVDIKNKKTPQAFERIVWVNGLMKLLNFDECVVATTDKRPSIHSFGNMHNTTILDGMFLSKLKRGIHQERLSEEELMLDLGEFRSFNTYPNKDWRSIYQLSKSKLLTELDFAGFNSLLDTIRYFIIKSMTEEHKRPLALRLTYLLISQILIITDFVIKDIAFLDHDTRAKKLSQGFKYGNLGKERTDQIINMAVKIGGTKSAHVLKMDFETLQTDIFAEFFGKSENTKSLFVWAKELENLGYRRQLSTPSQLEVAHRGVISVFLDYFQIERRKYFAMQIS